MGKDKGRDKGDKIRAERALAEAERRACAGTGDSEVAGKPDRRQKEDGDDSVQPKKKQKQASKKSDPSYRMPGDKPAKPREKIIAQKSPGTFPQKGFQNMDKDEYDENDDWKPEVKKSDTNQKSRKNQTGDRQNSAGGGKLVLYQAPPKATNPR
jgi:hypothetical protein